MTTLSWECDMCEQPRYSAQMLRCDWCFENRQRAFFGYCCIGKHTDARHPGGLGVKATKVSLITKE